MVEQPPVKRTRGAKKADAEKPVVQKTPTAKKESASNDTPPVQPVSSNKVRIPFLASEDPNPKPAFNTLERPHALAN